MQYLIAHGESALQEAPHGTVVDFVRVRHESKPELKKRKLPERPTAAKPPPEPPPLDLSKLPPPSAGELGSTIPVLATGPELIGGPVTGLAPSEDTDVIPLVRIAPQYPPSAQARGIEGWVEIELTISKAGTVVEPHVVAADPPHIFDRAALRAIRRWKYKPKIENGQPVPRSGVHVVIRFQLEKG